MNNEHCIDTLVTSSVYVVEFTAVYVLLRLLYLTVCQVKQM